jgi:hypothetical protein
MLIHHEGTKVTKDASAAEDAFHAVLEEFDIEVDEKTNLMAG